MLTKSKICYRLALFSGFAQVLSPMSLTNLVPRNTLKDLGHLGRQKTHGSRKKEGRVRTVGIVYSVCSAACQVVFSIARPRFEATGVDTGGLALVEKAGALLNIF